MIQRVPHILPLGVSALTLLLIEVTFLRPRAVFLVGAIAPFLFFVAIYLIMGRNLKTPSARLKFLITPTLLVWSALAFSLLLEARLAAHLLALLVFVFLILFFESIMTYIWRHEAYVGYSLENLAAYALTLATFLGSSVILGSYVLLDVPIGLIAVLFLLLFLAVNFELFWIGKFAPTPSWRFIGVATILLVECALAFAAFPFHFMVGGAALTVLWYTGVSISRAHILGLLSRKTLTRHLALCGMLIVILMVAGAS